MNLRTLLTATWLCIVAVVYLSLYFVCHVAHSKFAGIIAAGSAAARAKGKRNQSGSVQDLIDDVEIGSGLWLADEESSDDDEESGGGGRGRTVLLIEGDPV